MENVLLKMLEWEKLIARNMEQIILNLNASFVVTLLNGSVGETLTSVKNVILVKIMEIMCLENLKVSFLNAQVLISVL